MIRARLALLYAFLWVGSIAVAQPTITSLSPARNALDVAVDANILISFSADMNALEAIQPGKVTVKGSLAGKYSTNNTYNAGSRVLTVNPADNFLPGEVITVTLDLFYNEAYTGYTPRQVYSFTVATGGTGQGFFSTSELFGTMPSGSFDATFGDLDGDGDLDVVALENYTDRFYILRKSNSADEYIYPSHSETYTVGGSVNFRSVKLNDMDNDGDLDIILAINPGAGTPPFYIYTNNGTGSFSLSTSIMPAHLSTSSNYFTFAADWNRDGLDDIFTVADNVQGLWPFYQNTLGSYTEGTSKINGIKGRFAVSGDFNNDGSPDFALIRQVGDDAVPTNDSLGVILSDGLGSFTRQTYRFGGTSPWGMTSGDFDGDGYVDLVISADSVYIFDNDQDGTFTKRTIGKTYSYDNIKTGDIDGDGDLDLAILSSTHTFLFNDGNGNFETSYYVSRGGSGFNSDLGDADGDGDLDLIYAVNGNIRVYRNSTISAPSSPASFSSFSSNWGTQVTLNWTGGDGTHTLVIAKAGSAVDASPANNTVYTAGDFGTGSEVSTGNFVVYSGNASAAVIKGLSTGTTYHFKIIEMNRAGDAVSYHTSPAVTNVATAASAGYDLELTAGRAKYFNGQSFTGFVDSGVGSAFTAEMWVKPDAVTTDQVLLIYDNDDILIGLNAEGRFYAEHANGGARVGLEGTSTAAASAWYHVALTGSSGGNLVLYVNGQAEDSAPLTTATVAESVSWYLATNWNEDKLYAGAMDEIRLWTTARTASEIRATMHRPPAGFAPGLKYYWQFQQPEYGGPDFGFDINRYDKIAQKWLNTDGYSWVTSTIPFGDVVVNAATGVTSGTTAVGNATLTVADAFDNPVDIQVTEFETLPVNMPAGYSFAKSDRYFVIDLFGDPGTFSVNLTLTLGANAFTAEEIATPSLLKLFKRSSTSVGGWTLAASGLSAENTNGQVVFNGITSFSQFVVTSGDPFFLLSQVSDTTIVIDAQLASDDEPVLIDMSIFPWAAGYQDSTMTLTVNDDNFDGYMYLNPYDDDGDQLYSGDSYSFNAANDVFEFWPSEPGLTEMTFTFAVARGNASITVKLNVMELEAELIGDAGLDSWHMMANPFDTSLGSLLGSLWTQGAQGTDAPSGTPTVYTFDGATGTYTPVTSNFTTTKLNAGQGFAAFLFADDNPTDGQAPPGGGWPKTLSVSPGATFGASVNLPLSNTDIDEDEELSGNEGWTLVGNPFGFQIGVSDLVSAIDDAFTVYGGEEGPPEYGVSEYVYTWHPVDLEWVAADYGAIPAYQSVFVRLLRPAISGSITMDNSFRNLYGTPILGGGGGGGLPPELGIEANPDQQLQTADNQVFTIRFNLNHAASGLASNFSLSFSSKGLPGIDSKDMFHLRSMSSKFAHMYSAVGDQALKVNHLPVKHSREMTFPMHLEASERGTFTIAWNPSTLPAGYKAVLYEPSTGRSFDLAADSLITFESAAAAKATGAQDLAGRTMSAVTATASPQFILTISPVATSNEVKAPLPTQVELFQNFPNPFNPSTTLQFGLPAQSAVTLEVFDMLGRRVATLLNGEVKAAGRHQVSFDASRLASGLYLYRLSAGGRVMSRRMTLVK